MAAKIKYDSATKKYKVKPSKAAVRYMRAKLRATGEPVKKGMAYRKAKRATLKDFGNKGSRYKFDFAGDGKGKKDADYSTSEYAIRRRRPTKAMIKAGKSSQTKNKPVKRTKDNVKFTDESKKPLTKKDVNWDTIKAAGAAMSGKKSKGLGKYRTNSSGFGPAPKQRGMTDAEVSKARKEKMSAISYQKDRDGNITETRTPRNGQTTQGMKKKRVYKRPSPTDRRMAKYRNEKGSSGSTRSIGSTKKAM